VSRSTSRADRFRWWWRFANRTEAVTVRLTGTSLGSTTPDPGRRPRAHGGEGERARRYAFERWKTEKYEVRSGRRTPFFRLDPVDD
jgi:hypothetical protein